MNECITEEDCQIVRDLHDEGLSDSMIAHRFGLTDEHIRSVVEGWF